MCDLSPLEKGFCNSRLLLGVIVCSFYIWLRPRNILHSYFGELWDTQAIDPWDLISLSALRLMVGGDTCEEFKDILSDILVS